MIYRLLFLFVTLAACQANDDSEALRLEVLETDKNFNRMAQEKGIAAAFIFYADENVVKPAPGRQPIVGKFALMESFKNNPLGESTLRWSPLKAEASGNLGYTFGGYTLQTKSEDGLRDTVLYGTYVSIWKRKNDGSWRYVFDTGNPTPGPAELNR
ncbi:MAG: YybH family protein [Cyclobacteriaceae bacterium]